jgi:hypothetical protein
MKLVTAGTFEELEDILALIASNPGYRNYVTTETETVL